MSPAPSAPPADWFKRRAAWAWRQVLGTSGSAWGPGGAERAGVLRAYAAIALLLAALDTVNVLNILTDAARYGQAPPAWKPITWELTSGLSELAVCGIIYLALRLARPGEAPWGRTALVHGLGSIVFSGAHVGLMTLMRAVVYSAAGVRYGPGSPSWLYEYRKDALAYVLLGGVFWLFTRPRRVEAVPPQRPATFDIVDGLNVTRTPVSSILSIQAAGNYVEFHLADGRRPLMRTSVREMAGRLAPFGFLRTHRSWIVNAAMVRGLVSCGSGDFDLQVEGGGTVPLSRRYPAALSALRRG